MKIGVIGSGIAGLTAAWILRKAGCRVTLIEKQDRIGMSAHGVDLNLDGKSLRGDVPSRMFNQAQWPRLLELYQVLGVEFEPVDTSQSFSDDRGRTYLKLKLPYQFVDAVQLLQSKPRRIVSEMKRLQTEGENDLAHGLDHTITLHDYLRSHRYSDELISGFLYPILSSTVCTCSYASLDQYPAAIILSAVRNISVNQTLLKTRFGTADIVHRIITDVDILSNTEVRQVVERDAKVEVHHGDTQASEFDHVIVATQANHAVKLDRTVPDKVARALSRFEYEYVPVVVHRDPRLMPADRRDWATFNMLSSPSAAMCTVWMNRFHDNWNVETPVFQTINPLLDPDEKQVISRFHLQRPVVTTDTHTHHAVLEKYHQQERRIWYCGSYAAQGIPLLETGVVSAERIADRITQTVLHGTSLLRNSQQIIT